MPTDCRWAADGAASVLPRDMRAKRRRARSCIVFAIWDMQKRVGGCRASEPGIRFVFRRGLSVMKAKMEMGRMLSAFGFATFANAIIDRRAMVSCNLT
jgi:hypothetical protein